MQGIAVYASALALAFVEARRMAFGSLQNNLDRVRSASLPRG